MSKVVRAAVLGATGYTGAELLRLLDGHPEVAVVHVFGNSTAGQRLPEVLPSLVGTLDLEIERFDVGDTACEFDVAFCCLPHGASAPAVSYLREQGVKVFDLSADFRLRDRAVFEAWYGEHGAPELFGTGVYGLVELHREAIKAADLVAVPGCYPTASILALAPLFKNGLVAPGPVVVDAKSGVSGAGRGLSKGAHFAEAGEGVRAYKSAGRHRHTPEIEQELTAVAGTSVSVTFTPHLIPMTRGLLATAYVQALENTTGPRCTEAARELYGESSSVTVLEEGAHPDTTWVRGSNKALVSYAVDSRTGLITAYCAIDNLVKGASGQAVQCLNLRFGWAEGLGVAGAPVWP